MPKKIGLRMILYLYLAVFLTRIGFGSITILFPLYLNAQPFQVGIILALYPIAEALSAMPVGRLADKVSRKRLHLAGMATITVLTAAIGFTQNLLNVSLLHALMGISAAMAAVTSLTLLGDATKQTSRGTKMGGFDLANLGGYGLGFGLGSLLINEFANSHYGLSEAFWVTSGIFFATSLLATKFLVEPVRSFELNQPGVRHRRIGARLRPVLPVWLGQTIVLGMYFLLPKAFASASFTVTRQMLIFLGVIGGLFALGAIVFGHISDKVGRTKINHDHGRDRRAGISSPVRMVFSELSPVCFVSCTALLHGLCNRTCDSQLRQRHIWQGETRLSQRDIQCRPEYRDGGR